MTTQPLDTYDVIIVGAGIAGLRAAREIRRRSPMLSLLVLEAKDRVGGRTYSIPLRTKDGTDVWDIGGQWIGRTQHHSMDLIKELGVEVYPQYVTGEKLSQLGTAKIRPYSDNMPASTDFRNYSPIEGEDWMETLNALEKKAREINYNDPFSHPDSVDLDSITVQEWANQNCRIRTSEDSLDTWIRAVIGCPADRVSLLYLLMYGKAAGAIVNMLVNYGKASAQEYKMKGCAQQLSIRMADELPHGSIILNQAVCRVDQDLAQEKITVYTLDNTVNEPKLRNYHCHRLIMAIPPSQCGRIEYKPPLPDNKHQLFQSFPMGNFVKAIVTYERPFWRDKGFSGEIIASGLTVKRGERRPLMNAFDATTDRGNPALVLFFHNEYAEVSKVERRDAMIKDLTLYFGEEAARFIDYEDLNWGEVPYSGGCPVAFIAPGVTPLFMRIREPSNMIHWAGTETATVWPGYMSGAIQSGLRAAHEVLTHLDPGRVLKEFLEDSIYADNYKPPSIPDCSYTSKHLL